ncbi:MAG: FlgD immunoglobulin-like domain containing protein, partial [Blastocatellia bacterium]
MAIDLNYNGTSNRRILAGGVSGGMFLSTDDGATWQMTTTLAQFSSATCLVQDPTNRNTWYYGTGEFSGSTRAGGRGIPGQGIFKSTDGGVTWSQLPATLGSSATQFDNVFDFVWNLAFRPQSSAIFAATLGSIQRSTNNGDSWTALLVGQDTNNFLSLFSDVAIAANGDVYATLSRNGLNLTNQQYGVFRSTNGGNQFTVISPPGLSSDPYRMVLATAPSEANTLYLLVQANANGAVAADHQLFRYNAANNSWTDLSAGLPNAQGLKGNASFSSQGGYDLIVKVQPDNANTVWIGGTNLYRSTNGGQNFTLVGGYRSPNTYAQFDNHHSD